MKKIPIGIQAFSSLIKEGFVYLDKSDMIYNLANNKACYFLSRPRRFGKSLTLSTLHEYFDGQKDLFKGLKIEKLETKWEKYPVLHFDFNSGTYNSVEDVQSRISYMISQYEKIFGKDEAAKQNSERFESLINSTAAQTGKEVVVLVDEYDKPLLNNIDNKELQNKIRSELKAFYSVLKTCDKQIKMAFITGVTKFSKVSLFSDVNNLTDISQEREFSTLCGITEKEIHEQLDDYVQQMADTNGISKDECYKELKKWYEGYHFSKDVVDIYNPFGLMKALYHKDFNEYWFESGTPTFLVKEIQKNNMKLSNLDRVECDENDISKIDNFAGNPVPLLFQSGYLTIKGYDKFFKTYILGMPNQEISEAFTKFILNFNFPKTGTEDFSITNFARDVIKGDYKGFMKRLTAMFADNSYQIVGEAELYFQNVTYLIFKLLGFYTEAERTTSDGRIDAVVKTPQYIYVFEFKLDKPAKEALEQINSKEYTLPFNAGERKLFKIGVSFSSETRKIAEWVAE
ncbi:MAG: ATP-binding protein [Bacteroidales bacterium]|nr:ATP-binding protein [Bacteroidales bacterium]